MGRITIVSDSLEDAIQVLNAIPEFENVPDAIAIHARIDHVPHLVLTAFEDQLPIAFKIGYLRDGMFYSWLGAVLPKYRQSGVARSLAEEQERWALTNGYESIWMKTRNCFPEMLIMALRTGFTIRQVDVRDELAQNRIVLEKRLNAVT